MKAKGKTRDITALSFKLALICLLAVFLLSACGTKPWVVVEGVRAWSDQNYASLEKRIQDAQCSELYDGQWQPGNQYYSDECVFMRRYIQPYMNILKHALAAAEAVRIKDDVLLASECYIITKIAANLGVSYTSLTSALLNKDIETASAQIEGLEAFVQANAGVAAEPPEKEGWLQRALNWIW